MTPFRPTFTPSPSPLLPRCPTPPSPPKSCCRTGRPWPALPPNFDAATYYQHAFGITRPDNGEEPQELRLRFMPVQGRYALRYPLHASQRLVHETEEGIEVTLTVYDTHELRMELLSYGPEVEVLAPLGTLHFKC